MHINKTGLQHETTYRKADLLFKPEGIEVISICCYQIVLLEHQAIGWFRAKLLKQ